LLPFPPPSARPNPVDWRFNQTTPHRICMEVLDSSHQCPRRNDVSIISTSGLPEVMFHPTRLFDRQPLQPPRTFLPKERDSTTGNGLFDRLQNIGNLVVLFLRHDDEVDVFRHDDVGPKMHVVLTPSPVQSFDEPLADTVLGEQLVTLVARKGQLVGMSRIVHAASSMADRTVGQFHKHKLTIFN